MSRWLRVVVAILFLAGGGLGLWFWLRPDGSSQQKPENEEDPDPLQAVVNPGYVGIGVCAECHAERCTEFQRTRHFHACVPASGIASPGFAPGRGVHPTRDPTLSFEMSRSGDEYLATVSQATSQGVNRVAYPIDLAYGAGGAGDEMYFSWRDDQLYNLPLGWLYPLNRWGHTVETIEPREAPSGCVECHNTWAAHAPGTANRFRRSDMILSVTCERCHGPGQEHVAYHRIRPKETAHAITHPGHLDRERLIEVCTQCHSNVKRRGPAFSYRPGEPLENHFHATPTRHPEEDIVANQIQYLRESKCFQESQMTCITCHKPHGSSSADAIKKACLKCHAAKDCKEQPKLPAVVSQDCVGCHMPSRVWMNVRFHTSDDQFVPVAPRADHRIAIHPEAKQAVLLAHLRKQSDAQSKAQADDLAKQLADYWLKEAEQRRRANRLLGTIGALREALKVEPGDRVRRRLQSAIAEHAEFDRLVLAGNAASQGDRREAIAIFRRILEIKPDYVPARGELGTMYLLEGDRREAQIQLELAAESDPEDSYCRTALAALAYREGRWEEAETLFARADEIDPGNADTHYGWGTTLMKRQRWVDAEEHFRQALKLDPRHGAGSAGLSEALQRQGRAAEAIEPARRAVRWTRSENAQMLLTLAEAYAAANRTDDARKTLKEALSVANENRPDLVPTIRARLGKLD